jgi:hypothetical protein
VRYKLKVLAVIYTLPFFMAMDSMKFNGEAVSTVYRFLLGFISGMMAEGFITQVLITIALIRGRF